MSVHHGDARLSLKTMAEPALKQATYEDLFTIPEHHVGQIIDGVLYTHARPASPHAMATSMLSGELVPPFRRGRGGPGGWVILFEPELHLGRDVLVPDLAGWRRARMPEMPDTAAFTLAPDWVCEVLSPSTARVDRVLKLPVYAREQVGHVWFVDPVAQTLEVFELREGVYALVQAAESEQRGRFVPFDALELDLALLWTR